MTGKSLRRLILWVLLAMPAALLLHGWVKGELLSMDLLEPSGDMAVRLMILALLPGPLREVFGPSRFLRGWLAIRRNLGVAAFLYALIHLAFYAIDLASLHAIIDELELPGIWTGWLALIILLPAAATSTNWAMRALGARWPKVQRVVYPTLLLTFVHWLLLEWDWQKAAIHAAPLIIVWTLRAGRKLSLFPRRPT